jgi:signal transduction histidine kinase/HAMP domain-containing protein
MANKSLVKKITAGSTTLVVCAFFIAMAANYWHALAQANEAYQKQLTQQLNLLSQSLEGPLWSLDDNTIQLIGDAYMAGTDAVSLKIFSQHSKGPIYSKKKVTNAKIIYGKKEVSHNDESIGLIQVGLSGASYAASLSRLLTYSIILGVFIVLALSFVMKVLFRKHLEKPLESLGIWTDRVASGDYGGTPPQIELEELSSLANKFSNMSEKIQNREQSLQTSEKKFRGLFENTEVSIWNEDISEVNIALEKLRQEGVTDLGQHLRDNLQTAWDLAAMVKITQVNEATLNLFGAKTHDEMLGQINETFGPNAIEVFIGELCAIWNKEKTFRSEASYRTLDGKELVTIVSFHIPETPDGFRSVPVSIIDITERKRAEKELVKYRDQLQSLVEEQTHKLKKAQSDLIQRERLATLGELTATVSHELRNPLGTIQVALFSINDSLECNEPHRACRSLELAERNIGRCVNIIEELNDYARVKGLVISEGSLDDWLQSVFNEITLPEEIHCELDLSSGVQALFDQEKLRQVVVNLTTNAVHALLDEGSNGKLLQVSTRRLDGEYEIRISDNGIGMSDDTKEKMFEPLFSTKGFGVGLGMVIVKNIVEQHHGKISAESKTGEGTTITLCLPISLPEDSS